MFGKASILATACLLMVASAQGRVKRQAAPPPQEMLAEVVKCCPFPTILTTASKTGCFTGLLPGGLLVPNMANHHCEVECAYKKQMLVTSANVVDNAALSARVAELATSNTAWASAINKALAFCTDNPPVMEAGEECTSGAGEMSRCLIGAILMNCPAEVADPSEKCSEHIEKLKNFKSG